MNCTEVIALLDPLIDGELSKKDQNNLDIHLGNCPDCMTELGEMQALKNSIKEADIFAAPDSLKTAIKNSIYNKDIKPKPYWTKVKYLLNPITTHAGIALFSGLMVLFFTNQSFQSNTLHSDIFEAHMRSLASENIVTVASSDQHTVKPWFAGKVPYSPSVPDLRGEGFILLGGRVDRLKGEDIAVLTYQRRKHKINVFISPIGKTEETHLEPWSKNGYNIVFWRDNTFAYTAISDISEQELELFFNRMNSILKRHPPIF